MSRIGKQPITIPEDVDLSINDNTIIIKGPKGELTQNFPRVVSVEKKEDQLVVRVKDPENKGQRSLWGTYARLISNMIDGVREGYEKRLELVGVGFRARVEDKILVLNIGFSNPIKFKIPQGIEVTIESNNIVIIKGIDKQLVGETAAQIRRLRKPEPYKGKGIKYSDEIIRRKAGKKATATAET
ncbi:50S ribosomal protein L6 [Patescibacteria group bacterium AH-259-L05]|nr:50S ribosomal protein L6 [Patescibacteria group bacterium AH-259-L05]